MSGIGHNQIKSIVERIERLEEEAKSIKRQERHDLEERALMLVPERRK